MILILFTIAFAYHNIFDIDVAFLRKDAVRLLLEGFRRYR